MSRSKLIPAVALAAGIGLAAAAQAGPLLVDNFDTDAGTSILNFTGFANWDIVDGTVDYIRQGGFGISCVGGTGGCVDLDGSTANAGRMVSKAVFALDAAANYMYSFALSGNQRGGSPDSFRVGLTDGTTDILLGSLGNLASGSPFTSYTVSFTGVAGNYRLFIQDGNAAGDNIGPILDNVRFESDQAGRVPEPGSLALIGLALAGVAASRRRRR